jgi:predicted RNA-binding Zn ribbon-like protein
VSADDGFLLDVLNSTPVIDREPTDNLADLAAARPWLVAAGGLGTQAELSHLLRARTALQGIVRGELPVSTLRPLLDEVAYVPRVEDDITWTLAVEPQRRLAIRAILAWDNVVKQGAGRLRACANDECRLFLIDRSSANRARWCSMAVCGNRMKARRHYQRARRATGAAGQ